MLRFMVHSSKISRTLHRRCARSIEYPQASENVRHFSDDQQVEQNDTKKLSGFAKSDKIFTSITESVGKPSKDTRSFAELFRNSNFVDVSITAGQVVFYIHLQLI